MHQPTHLLMLLFSLVALLMPLSSAAQSVRDLVNTTVDDGLEKEKEKAKAKKEKKEEKKAQKKEADSKEKSAASEKSEGPPKTADEKNEPEKTEPTAKPEKGKTLHFDSSEPEKEIPPEEKLPKRVLHEYIQLDPAVGGGYHGWVPQQYPTLESKMASYFTWSVDMKGRFFKYVNLKKGYYESNGASPPRLPYRSDAAKYGSWALKAAWFLMELGVPIAKAWEPSVRYETRAFQTNARSKSDEGVCIVKFGSDADEECTDYRTRFSMISSMETAVLGVTYYPSKNPSPVTEDTKGKKPPIFFGLGYLSYVKPYQVTIGSTVLEELLFTGRFYGGGLALGTKFGGGVNRPYIAINTQFGLGASRLTKDLTLNEVAPQDWLIGYLQGTLSVSFKWAPFKFKPTFLIVPSLEANGALFFFFETDRQEGEEFVTPNVNRDLMYTAKLYLIVTL